MATSGSLATVLYDFAAEEDDELPVRRGDIVYIMKTPRDGPNDWVWVQAATSGREGQVPVNYLADGDARPLPLPKDESEEKTASGLELPSVKLPPGWTQSVDDVTGLPYYYHAETGRSSWETPGANGAVPPTPIATREETDALQEQLRELQEMMKVQAKRLEVNSGEEDELPEEGSPMRPSPPLGNMATKPSPRAGNGIVGFGAPQPDPAQAVSEQATAMADEAAAEEEETLASMEPAWNQSTSEPTSEDPTEERIRRLEAEAASLRAEREMREAEEEQVDGAATMLQASWRGLKGRRDAAEKAEERHREAKAQLRQRVKAGRRTYHGPAAPAPQDPPKVNGAAPASNGGIDEKVVGTIAAMVETRLRKEFEERDLALQGVQSAIQELSVALHNSPDRAAHAEAFSEKSAPRETRSASGTPRTKSDGIMSKSTDASTFSARSGIPKPTAAKRKKELPPLALARPSEQTITSEAAMSPAPLTPNPLTTNDFPDGAGAHGFAKDEPVEYAEPVGAAEAAAPAGEAVTAAEEASPEPQRGRGSVQSGPSGRRVPAPGFRKERVRKERNSRGQRSPRSMSPRRPRERSVSRPSRKAAEQNGSPGMLGSPGGSPKAHLPRVANIHKREHGYRTTQEVQRDEASTLVVRYSNCRSAVYPPSSLDATDIGALEGATPPGQNLTLDYVYGYNGDYNRPAGPSYGGNVKWLKSGELVFPAAAAVVVFNYETNTQRFFLGHDADVTSVAVHPKLDIVASGQDARVARVCVFDVSSADATQVAQYNDGQRQPQPSKQDAGAGSGVGVGVTGASGLRMLAQMTLGKNSRGVASLDFSPDGHLLLAVSNDDYHSVSVHDWRHGTILCTARSNNAAVHNVAWNPFCFLGVDEADYSDDICYSIVSCGVRHIKLWTLTRREEFEPPALPAMMKGVCYGNIYAKNCEYGKYNRGLEDVPPPSFLHTHSRTREMLQTGSWRLDGKQGSYGRFEIEDITCVAFTCDRAKDYANDVSPESRILAGTGSGDLMVWMQATDGTAGQWQPRGKALASVPGIHVGPITDITLVYHDDKCTVATAAKDGRIVVWALGPPGGKRSDLPIQPLRVAYASASGVGVGPPRALSLDATGSVLIVGTAGNALCLFDVQSQPTAPQEPDRAIIPADASIPGMQSHLLLQGHNSSCRQIAAHPQMRRFVSCGGDRTVRMWDADSRRLLSTARLGDKTMAVAFSPGGEHIAVGTEKGDIVVMQYQEANDGQWEVVAHKNLARRSRASKRAAPKEEGAEGEQGPQEQPEEWQGKQRAAAVMDIKYSPDGEVLAVACRDNRVNLLSVSQGYKRLASCKGHSTIVTALDFSSDSAVLRSNDAAREILHWEVATGRQISSAFSLRDVTWDSWTCVLGWPVQGIWGVPPTKRKLGLHPNSDKGREHDVQTVSVNNTGDVLAIGDDAHRVMLFKYPCLPGAQPSAPALGHMAKVTCVRFTCDDQWLLSAGGKDAAVFQWRVDPDVEPTANGHHRAAVEPALAPYSGEEAHIGEEPYAYNGEEAYIDKA
uniref:Calmodulin n=1 Tax=Phaeomonas parva TaxID=124430 RepID=A0A7S1XVQ1_9STRA|mmetsp:Transcript_44073/g.138500  ORF Transcript_44073/g.138500 Transcript_44073/m.138500 type:complete len:1530 (+) Transcript_44073:241-4830(+)